MGDPKTLQALAEALSKSGVVDEAQRSEVLSIVEREFSDFSKRIDALNQHIVATVNDASRLTGSEGSVEERLAYVLEMTQNAANTTMDEVDAISSITDDDEIQKHAQNILVAQGYQDLCGQFLQQIIQLINQLHEGLNRLGESASSAGLKAPGTAPVGDADGASAEGPQLKTASANKVAHNQDDVDDLLSDLGL